ncbi:PAB-dependent poly(A)-specific ribonuclease subunit 3 [Puttea exsequens]|nr:PAB-dependent poly(A)-specific ribonuclease subunit 3 [Puttea exsequens]
MAFSTTAFGDSSLILVYDYHPASNAVADQPSKEIFPRANRNPHTQKQYESLESAMWNYIVQVANGLRSIHSHKIAARNINIHKVLVTEENRIRLNGCAVKDITDKDSRSVQDLQQEDLNQFGLFIIAAAARHAGQTNNRNRGLDTLNNSDPRLRSAVEWLLDRSRPANEKTIDIFLGFISLEITNTLDASLRLDDELQDSLANELENARVVRLMTKLNCLTERPEYEHDRSWTVQGARGVIPLFRDFVFHQVDSQNNPVLDMGHILGCLNKLDAGLEEKVQLMTRDEQSIMVLSYKEMKAEIDRAWQQLIGRSSR